MSVGAEIQEVLEFFVVTGLLVPLGLAVLAAVLATWVARRRGAARPLGLIFSAVVSLAGVLVFTLFREATLVVEAVIGGESLVWPGVQGLGQWSPDGWWRASADPLGSTQVVLNTALFVPAGFTWMLLTRRAWLSLGLASLLSLFVEVIQAVTGLGANDVADIVANVVGAAFGVAVATAALWVHAEARGRPAGTRRWLLRVGAIALAISTLVVVAHAGAALRQVSLAQQARDVFAGTSIADVQRWDRQDSLTDRLWRGALDREANGFLLDPPLAMARYPAGFLGVSRFVLVFWTETGATVVERTGSVCAGTMLWPLAAETALARIPLRSPVK